MTRMKCAVGYILPVCYRMSSVFMLNKHLYHRISTHFPPIYSSQSLPKSSSAKLVSQRMQDAGIITSMSHGLYTLLPMGLRAIQKLVNITDSYMEMIHAQKLSFPFLTSSTLWQKSGRLNSCGPEVLQVIDRQGHNYVLSPTHEEAVTDLIGNFSLAENRLPLRIYQISTKFRDEMRIKHGLLRGREFMMKDLYSFDKDLEASKATYDEVSKIYNSFFQGLVIPFKRVEAPVGMMGGSLSHEYHIPASIGEDTLYNCEDCDVTFNSELFNDADPHCPKCQKPMKTMQGIEIGHTFLLGTKYSSPMSAKFSDANGKSHLLQMGCYGIGLTRLLAAALEARSTPEHFIWPLSIAPYKVCLVPAKRGSKEQQISSSWCEHFYNVICSVPGYSDDVIIDDRTKFTIGRRLTDIRKLGIPFIIVIGKGCTSSIPHFEFIDSYNNMTMDLTQLEILQHLRGTVCW